MSEIPLSLPLRPSTTKDATADSLPFLIAQINNQRGSFRHITEDSLLDEIQTSQPLNEQDDAEEGDTPPEDGKTRQEEVYKGREEILKQVAYVDKGSMRTGGRLRC